jgi:hypothetical protein
MTKYLTKDERNALVAEFNLGLPCSNPYFYVMKNKKGIINVKRVKEGAAKKEEPVEEVFSEEVQTALDFLEQELPGRIKVKKPKPPTEEVKLTPEIEETLMALSKQLGVKITVPKKKEIKEAKVVEEIVSKPLEQDHIVPAKEAVPETKPEKPKAL